MRKIVAAALLLLEILVAAYLTFMAYLLAGWYVDDSVAFQMSAMDWYVAAAWRIAGWSAVGAAYGAIAHLVNTMCIGPPTATPGSMIARMPWVLGGCVALASVFSAIRFAVEKPFI